MCNLLPAYATDGTSGFSEGLRPKRFPRSDDVGPYVDADTSDGIAPVDASFTLSDEHHWNNRLFMTSGPLKVVDHTHQPIEEVYGDICPRQRKQYESGTTWASDITPQCTDRTMTVGCCTTSFPSMTRVALLPYPVVNDGRLMPYIPGAARIHNKAMHSANGNIFIKGFSEVKATPGWKHVVTSPATDVASSTRLEDYETIFTGLSRHSAPVVTDLRNRGQLTDMYTGVDNILKPLHTVRFPCSPLHPLLMVCFGDEPPTAPTPTPTTTTEDPQTSTQTLTATEDPFGVTRSLRAKDAPPPPKPTGSSRRLGVIKEDIPNPKHIWVEKMPGGLEYFSFACVDYRSNMLADTAKAVEIKQAAQNAAATRFRATDIDASGYLSLDVFSVAQESIAKGFNLEAPILRLLLLSDALSLQENICVPKNFYSNIDPLLTYDPEKAVMAYNNNEIDGIDGEHCFPFVGAKGTLRIHLSYETIEPARRSSAVFAPPFLFQTSQNPDMQFFLFILSLCEWPTGIFSYYIAHNVPNPGTDITNKWLHRSSLTRVPGPTDIDIIIPRRTSERRPQTQADCIKLAQWVPRYQTDDDVWHDCLFTTQIGAQQDNDLSQFIETYMEICTVAHVHHYLSTLNSNFGVDNTVAVCTDLVVASNYAFPMLYDSTNIPSYPSGFAWDVYPLGTTRHAIATATIYMGMREWLDRRELPWTTARKPSAQLFEFSYQAWNKVVLGLAASEDTVPSPNVEFRAHSISKKRPFWLAIRAMMLVTVSQIYYSTIGLTSLAWDTAKGNTYSEAIQYLAMNTFCQELCPGKLYPPPLAKIYTAIHQHLFSYPMPRVNVESLARSTPITCFSRQIIPTEFAKPIKDGISNDNIASSTIYTPCVLIDVFTHLLTEKNIRFMCNLLPAYATDGTSGFSEGMRPKRFPRSEDAGC